MITHRNYRLAAIVQLITLVLCGSLFFITTMMQWGQIKNDMFIWGFTLSVLGSGFAFCVEMFTQGKQYRLNWKSWLYGWRLGCVGVAMFVWGMNSTNAGTVACEEFMTSHSAYNALWAYIVAFALGLLWGIFHSEEVQEMMTIPPE